MCNTEPSIWVAASEYLEPSIANRIFIMLSPLAVLLASAVVDGCERHHVSPCLRSQPADLASSKNTLGFKRELAKGEGDENPDRARCDTVLYKDRGGSSEPALALRLEIFSPACFGPFSI